MQVQRERFTAASRPVVELPTRLNPRAVADRTWREHRSAVPIWKLGARKALRADIDRWAATYVVEQYAHELAVAQRKQADADAWWEALNDGDPAAVTDALNVAFDDNPAPVIVYRCGGRQADLALVLPGRDVLPDKMPHLTPTGRRSARAWTKTALNDTYALLLGAHLLATLRETWAVAPSLTKARVMGIRREDDETVAYFDVLVDREGSNWGDDRLGELVLTTSQYGLRRVGQAGEVTAWRRADLHRGAHRLLDALSTRSMPDAPSARPSVPTDIPRTPVTPRISTASNTSRATVTANRKTSRRQINRMVLASSAVIAVVLGGIIAAAGGSHGKAAAAVSGPLAGIPDYAHASWDAKAFQGHVTGVAVSSTDAVVSIDGKKFGLADTSPFGSGGVHCGSLPQHMLHKPLDRVLHRLLPVGTTVLALPQDEGDSHIYLHRVISGAIQKTTVNTMIARRGVARGGTEETPESEVAVAQAVRADRHATTSAGRFARKHDFAMYRQCAAAQQRKIQQQRARERRLQTKLNQQYGSGADTGGLPNLGDGYCETCHDARRVVDWGLSWIL